jgi:hypothetical protein
MPCILEADVSKKRCQKNWARLIRKIYEVDPLVCPRCNGQMRITGYQEARGLRNVSTRMRQLLSEINV